ncbi:TetR/AcrR family transcriptional regulator [Saccharopolyspora elongata]|uniref:TetR/AcrR family transcriptional regulator n=1 Tax=Saccharopolyspora elongata TaxID=2530387 RepID=A0A4R4YJR4_9PSEU|nr:TetR/AcrR family transcriptional regulator [Saccharopolyspora elongata]TDD44259.1 TetR/AcrR family transcriptional regulator [Saccharopolyspora elongata]
MPKGQTKRRPKTTERLLDAALETFADRGFYGASIEEICDRADLTRGAFYYNYRTKEDLFFALFDLHAQRVIDRLTQAIEEMRDAPDPLGTLIARTNAVDDSERRWYLLSTEFTLHAIRNPETARALAEHDRRLRDEIVRLLGTLFDRLGRQAAVDLDSLARFITALHEGSLAQSLVEPDQLAPDELATAYLPPLIKAISRSRAKRKTSP